ncbi:protein O-mannosyl-transferase Tmtc4 [Chironomus tepperi]|uniref:protein O-mannosyl-transferase Tmtc4 n=1 Tax=Chironomus tepperi TaxID=113505 RepID=UPI00391F5653
MRLLYKYLIIICINLICYYQSIDGDFVFDDSVAILKNRDVYEGEFDRKTIENIFIYNDFWGNNITKKDSHKSYRPLTILTFLIERHLNDGLDSHSMKLVNLIIHIVNCCLLLNFLQAVLSSRKMAFIATVLFCVHPIHTESVCGIVSRSDLMACFVFLLCGIFYFYVFHKDSTAIHFSHSLIYLIIIGLMSFIGILFKENAVTIMPTLAALDIARNLKSSKKLSICFRLALMFVFTSLIVVFRLWMQNFTTPEFRVEDNPIAATDDQMTRILSQNFLYCFNFYLLLMPDWLSFDWSFDSIERIEGIQDVRMIGIVAFYGMLGALVVRSFRNRKIMAALVLLIVPFTPALGIIKVGFVIAERILYIPSIGFSILIAIGAKKLIENIKYLRPYLYMFITLVIIIHSMKTYTRSLDWRTESQLFFSALKVVPKNAKVYYNIARISSEHKQIDMSVKFYRYAIRLHPNYESAHMNLGNLYRELNEFEKAKFHLKKAVEILEEFPTAWMNLGIVQAVLKDFESSERSYLKALSYRKNYANCYYNMGNLYIEMKNSTAAIEHWKRAITINPGHRKAWSNILAFYDNQRNNHENVLKYSEIALTYLPNDTNILFSRANTFGKMAKYEEAERIFKQIIEAEPKKSIFYANLGVLYHRWGKKELAKKYYQSALALDASLKNAQSNLMKLQGFGE